MFKLAAFIFAFAVVFNILSIPKIPAEMRQFVEWLGMSATEWHWWNYAGFFGGLFFMALAAYGMYVHWDGRPSFLRRKSPKGTAYSVDAMGEFNRSSQHSGIGGCYDGTQTAVGSVWTEQVAFARSTGLGTA